MYHLILHDLVARAWIDRGDAVRAETLARRALELSSQGDTRLVEATTLPTLGSALAQQGRSAEAQHAFERAIELNHPMPHPFNEALTRYEWGSMLAEAGDGARAREQLDAALTIFRELGARPFVELSERALASLQARA